MEIKKIEKVKKNVDLIDKMVVFMAFYLPDIEYNY